MAKYLINDTTLTAIGDSVRELANTSSKLSPGAMATILADVVNTVNHQTDLIEQIKLALIEKGGSIEPGVPDEVFEMYSLGMTTATPASGVSQLAFSEVTNEPDFFIVFLNNADINQYHRVAIIVYDGTQIYGHEIYTGGSYETNYYENEPNPTGNSYRWKYTYSNGSLTVQSYSNSQGGYFHNPGTYTLLYGYKNDSGTIAVQRSSVTSSGNATTLQFTGLKKEPRGFFAVMRGSQDAQANPTGTVILITDAGYAYITGASTANYSFIETTNYIHSYIDGTLTISANNMCFGNATYDLIYTFEQ